MPDIPDPVPRGPITPLNLHQVPSSEASLAQVYRLYFQNLFRENYQNGLVAFRYHCRDLEYQPCDDDYRGYHFADSTLFSGWLLAALARDYNLGLHARAITLVRMHEILDALNRLSKYAHPEVIEFSREVKARGYATMEEEIAVRRAYLKGIAPTGYIIREDLGREFHAFLDHWQETSGVGPSIDQYMGILFGLVSVRKYVDDPALLAKAAAMGERIQNYLHEYNFTFRRPWDGIKTGRGNRAGKFRYPLSLAFRYIIGNDRKWKDIGKKWWWKKIWRVDSTLLASSTRMRCDENYEGFRLGPCHYFNDVMFFVGWAFLSLEQDRNSFSRNRRDFRETYLMGFLEFDQNPLLASVAHHFFGFNFRRYGIQESFATLHLAPRSNLPNDWASPWYEPMHESPSYRKNKLVPTRSTSRVATQKSGVGYLLTYGLRFPRGPKVGDSQTPAMASR